jgi:uncharacterized coiled-coil DUF342 family protein
MSVKETYETQVKSRMYELDSQIEELAAQIDRQAGDAKAESQKQLAALKAQRDQVNQRLKKVQDASGAAWEDLRKGADEAINSLAASLHKVRGRFDKVA